MSALFDMGPIEPTAVFSPCRTYRYELWRRWDSEKPYVMFIGLNPSTADEVKDDNTIRRCVSFAKRWGFGALCMANLFAYRATKPEDMKKVLEPIGPENNETLVRLAASAGKIIAAWGNHGEHRGRHLEVRKLLPVEMWCFGVTGKDQPKHPLYLPDVISLVPFDGLTIGH